MFKLWTNTTGSVVTISWPSDKSDKGPIEVSWVSKWICSHVRKIDLQSSGPDLMVGGKAHYDCYQWVWYEVLWYYSGTYSVALLPAEGSFTLERRQRQRQNYFLSFMNGLCGIQLGVFILGGGNGNRNGIIMEWVGYPFVTATATAMATYICTLPPLSVNTPIGFH